MRRSDMTLTKGQILGDESYANPPAHDAVNGRLVDATTEMKGDLTYYASRPPQPSVKPLRVKR